jgi:hypothetical protein
MLTLGGKLLDFAEKTVTDRQNRCERRESRTDARRRSERRRFSSASDDDGGGFQARCASRAKLDVEDAVVALLQCARDPASLDVAELLR